jgi:hypothetical protein
MSNSIHAVFKSNSLRLQEAAFTMVVVGLLLLLVAPPTSLRSVGASFNGSRLAYSDEGTCRILKMESSVMRLGTSGGCDFLGLVVVVVDSFSGGTKGAGKDRTLWCSTRYCVAWAKLSQ